MRQFAREFIWDGRERIGALRHKARLFTGMASAGIFPNSAAAASIWHWEQQFRWLRQLARESGFTVADRGKLAQHKTSDTLFVLGSAPSINAIDDAGWKEIEKHDSIGFNYFLLHPFVPTFYHMELRREEIPMYRRCYELRQNDYKKTVFMLNYHFLEYGALKAEDVSFIKDLIVTVPRTYSEAPTSNIDTILGFVQNRIEPYDDYFLLHYRGSLCMMVSLGLLLGYKNIVMVGVDLRSTGYFYCDERYDLPETKLLRSERCEALGLDNEQPHATVDPKFIPSTITIDRVMKILDEKVLSKRGVQLYVHGKESLLYPDFPVWNGEK